MTFEIGLLGALQAAVLAIIDIICVRLPGTRWAYWIDAPVEFALVVAWICAAVKYRLLERHSPGASADDASP